MEIRSETKQIKIDIEKLDDAVTEIAMATGNGKVLLFLGESFVDTSEEYAEECK